VAGQGIAPGAKREVVHGDALGWLATTALARASIVTSIPDVSETGLPDPAWPRWFHEAGVAVLGALPAGGIAIVTQTDIRREGRWIDKSTMVIEAARDAGVELVARKIVCRRPPGALSSARAAFTHLLVFGRGVRFDPALPDLVPDVMVDVGTLTWTRGTGSETARRAVELVRRYAPETRTVVDPFCGEGMILAVANAYGFDAIGVERNRKRAEKARRLSLEEIEDPRA
jgi:hypothetical protein